MSETNHELLSLIMIPKLFIFYELFLNFEEGLF